MSETIEARVHAFIVERFLFGRGGERLGYQDSLLDRNIIDSTGVLELVSFLEATFDVSFLDTELVPENLDSIMRIARFVERKQALVA
jgi:acyl carrier protein